MEVKETLNEGLLREFLVTISGKEINEQVDAELKKIGTNLKMPGFRPGKVPMDVLRRKYGDSVTEEAIDTLMRKYVKEILDSRGIQAASAPEAGKIDFVPNEKFEFKLTVDVLPQIADMDFGTVELAEYVAVATEAEIQEGLESIAKAARELKEVENKETAAAKGLVAKIDFEGFMDGQAFAGGTSKEFNLEIGSGHFVPGFEDQVEGMKAGDEREIKITFPDDYSAAHLAGKEALFKVKLHHLLEPEIPEINDALARKLGLEDGLEALRDMIKKQIDNDYKVLSQLKLKRDIFDYLEATLNFDVPQRIYEMEKKSIMEKLEQAKAKNDPSVAGKTDAELEAEYSKISMRRVRLGLFLSHVGKKNDIVVTENELRQAVLRQAKSFPGDERKVFDFYRNNPQYLNDLRGPLYEDKVVRFIMDNIKLTPQDVTPDELKKLYDADAEDEDLTSITVDNDYINVEDEAPHVHDEHCGHHH